MTPARASINNLLPDNLGSPPNTIEPVYDSTSDYGLSSDDEAELDSILSQLESAVDSSFVVTDIEDYEAPRGVYLPKVLGFEQRFFALPQNQSSSEAVRDRSSPNCKLIRPHMQMLR